MDKRLKYNGQLVTEDASIELCDGSVLLGVEGAYKHMRDRYYKSLEEKHNGNSENPIA